MSIHILWLLVVIGAVSPACVASAASLCDHQGGEARQYKILRGIEQVGTLLVVEHRTGDTVAICSTMSIPIRIFGFTRYQFRSLVEQRWSGGRLVHIESDTWIGNAHHRLSGGADAAQFTARYDGRFFAAPAGLGTTLFLQPEDDARVVLIDPAIGTLLVNTMRADLGEDDVSVDGHDRRLHHVRLTGSIQRDLWIKSGVVVCLRYEASDGSQISIELIT